MAPTSPQGYPDANLIARAPISAPIVVLGAPGSGKTTLLMDRMSHLVHHEGIHPDRIRLLTPSRRHANLVRDEIGLRLARTTKGALAMSLPAFAFDIVRNDAAFRGLPPPRLRSGADVDEDIASVLAEQLRSGHGPQWPEHLNETVRSSRSFRIELRELMARATEYGLSADDLAGLGQVHAAWPAVARFMEDYDRVVARSRPHDYDTPELVRLATSLIESGGAPFSPLEAILVDDAQDLSPAASGLLVALHNRGVHLTMCADPDVAAQTFRGTDPEGPMLLAQRLQVSPVVLEKVYRHGPLIRAAVSTLTGRIGAALAGSQRRAVSASADEEASIVAVISPGSAREAQDIARLLHHSHSEAGIDFSEMAVVVRRSGDIPALSRALSLAAIPVEVEWRSGLGQHPASRDLVAWVLAALHPETLTEENVPELLTGLYGGFDQRWLRRFRQVLRRHLRQADDSRSPAEAMVEIVREASPVADLPRGWAEDCERIFSVMRGVRDLPAESSAAVILSRAWELFGRESEWFSRASHPQHPSLFQAQALLQVGALLRSAERFHESHPGVSPRVYLESVLQAEIDEDVVMPDRQRRGVSVLTPSSLAGGEFDVVVLAGLNEHVWPNTRLRGSLLGAPLVSRFARFASQDEVDETRIVVDDELRMAALALSRARRHVIVTAVSSEDNQPSGLFRILASQAQLQDSTEVQSGSTRQLVGELRRRLVDNPGDDEVAEALAHAVSMDLPGADPSSWWGRREPSTREPLFEGEAVHLSPSALGAIESSALDWFLDKVAPEDLPARVGVGSLIHTAMQLEPWGGVVELAEIVDERWSLIECESPWQSRALHRQAGAYLVALAEYLQDRRKSGVELVASEFRFELALDDVVVSGSVDRIEREADGSLVVVDLKTGAVVSERDAAMDPQLSAYQLALADPSVQSALETTAEASSAWLLFVRQGKSGKAYTISQQLGLGAEGFEQFRQRLREARALVAAASFRGPREAKNPATNALSHRWQRVGSVCGD